VLSHNKSAQEQELQLLPVQIASVFFSLAGGPSFGFSKGGRDAASSDGFSNADSSSRRFNGL
jgi:hypothetical protein